MNWQVVFIGIIAVAVLAIAIGQVMLALVMARAARKVSAAVDEIKVEIKPLLDKASRIADDAGRVTQLAVIQVERVDAFLASTTVRIEDTLGLLQSVVGKPARQGAAIMAGFKAALSAVRAWQSRPTPHQDDEDPLFVG